jgi:hypothetical protein
MIICTNGRRDCLASKAILPKVCTAFLLFAANMRFCFRLDMKKAKREFVKMELTFPKDYPFSPPFIRVIEPRFKFHTGHVTIGGSICHEILTRSGWTPTNSGAHCFELPISLFA